MNFPEKFANLLVHPRRFFSKQETKTKPTDVAKFALYCLAIGLIINSLDDITRPYFSISFLFSDTIHVLIGSIGMLVVAFISAAISQGIGAIFFRTKENSWDNLRVFLYYVSTLLVLSSISSILYRFVPETIVDIFAIVVVFYLLYAIAVGLSAIHDISVPRAFIMTLVSTFLAMTAMTRIIDKAEDVIRSALLPIYS